MMLKYAIALAILLVLAVIVTWAFLPPRYLPGNRARHLRIRLHLRLHPGKGFATIVSLHLRWGRLAALRRSGRIRRSLPLYYRLLDPAGHSVFLGRAHYQHRLHVPLEKHLLVMAPPRTFKTVLALTSDTVPPGRVDAGGTRLRLRALHVMGHGPARIARALGVRETTIGQLVCGDARTVSPRLRDAIADLYDAWWDKRAPERTRAERGAATAARRRAIAGNWCAAAALDDDELDVPGYRPRQGWKPATGTGVAPDIRPPIRRRKPRP